MLRAGLDGVKNNLTPPQPLEENVYQLDRESLVSKNVDVSPTSLWEALNELKKDKLVQEVLGNHLLERYINIKTKEWDEFKAQVTSWEIARYLDIY
jgi:glutamine synthetase